MPRYIDADALNAYIESAECNSVGKALQAIDNAPTVSHDEVRGVGDWKQKEIINLEDTTIERMQSACCSVCGKYHTTPFSYYFSKYNYCPNCGAKMEVEQ